MDLGSVLLGGLVGSVLGSGLAYIGARRLQTTATDRQERGAARAVYYEVATIASDLTIAHKNGLPMPIVPTATYDQAAGTLAVFLTPTDFDVVAFAYYSIHLYQWHTPPGQTPDPALPDLPLIVSRFAAARDVLERAAFTPEESAQRRTQTKLRP